MPFNQGILVVAIKQELCYIFMKVMMLSFLGYTNLEIYSVGYGSTGCGVFKRDIQN